MLTSIIMIPLIAIAIIAIFLALASAVAAGVDSTMCLAPVIAKHIERRWPSMKGGWLLRVILGAGTFKTHKKVEEFQDMIPWLYTTTLIAYFVMGKVVWLFFLYGIPIAIGIGIYRAIPIASVDPDAAF